MAEQVDQVGWPKKGTGKLIEVHGRCRSYLDCRNSRLAGERIGTRQSAGPIGRESYRAGMFGVFAQTVPDRTAMLAVRPLSRIGFGCCHHLPGSPGKPPHLLTVGDCGGFSGRNPESFKQKGYHDGLGGSNISPSNGLKRLARAARMPRFGLVGPYGSPDRDKLSGICRTPLDWRHSVTNFVLPTGNATGGAAASEEF